MENILCVVLLYYLEVCSIEQVPYDEDDSGEVNLYTLFPEKMSYILYA